LFIGEGHPSANTPGDFFISGKSGKPVDPSAFAGRPAIEQQIYATLDKYRDATLAAFEEHLTPCGSLRLPSSAPIGSFHPTRFCPCWAH
jgi:hypothetical protein